MSFLLLAMALVLAPQVNPASTAISVAEQKCTISGTALAADTGQPLRDATVTIRQAGAQGSSSESVATDASGHFAIKNLEPGSYSLNAGHAGYLTMQFGQKDPNGPGRMLTLRPGQTARDISFQLLREAVITGHVYAEDGDPIERAQVLALRYRYFQGSRRLMPGGFAMTDDRGKYRLFDLSPGQYYISASTNPMGSRNTFTYGPSYYPGVTDPSQASPITLRAGNEFPGIDLTLQRIGIFHIRGRVTGGIGKATLTNTMLQIVTRTEAMVSFGTGGRVTDAQGDFEFPGVRPGSYFLIARLSNKGNLYQARQPVTVTDSDVDGVQLVLTPGATVKGIVQTEGSVDFSKVRFVLTPRDGVMMFSAPNSSAVGQDGTLEFDSIPDGNYLVRVFGLPQNAYVKSAKMGDEDVLDSGFTIANGAPPGSTLRIVVSANGGTIGGTVMLDGKPFNAALVTLLPDDPAKLSDDLWFKSATTDQYGSFTISGIRPGDYRLFAWEKIQQGKEREPDFYNQFKDDGREVHVGPGAALNFQLTVIPAKQTQAEGAQ